MDTRKNVILILASVGTFVEALDIAIINLTIPSIQEQFHIGAGTVQWLQTLYVLFFGGFLIIGGKLSDQLGRKKMFLLGAFIFMLTSLGAGLSENFESLAVFRALQGLGAAFVMPSALSIVTNTFREEQERNRAIGIFSSFAAIGSGSGLSVGGIISTYLSWHWVFLINVPILLITLILSYYYLPKDEKSETVQKTDAVSGILMVLGLLSLTYGTHELIHIKEQPFLVIGSLVLAVVLLVWVFYRLRSVAEPLIDLQLFKYKSLVVSNAAFFSLGAFFIGFLFLISLMLQKDMGYSAASAGLMLVPFSIVSALTAKFILPQVSKRLNSSQMGIFGWLFMLTGGILLLVSVYTGHPLTLVLLGAACISGIGMTFCFTALSVMGIQDVEPSNYGVASSLSSTSYFLGAGIGLSFMTLMSQIFPSEFAVGSLNLIILIGYAVLALGMLSYFIIRSLKVKRAEMAVSS
ncbi:EmrB/QacA subfamily drug resistance transporter [Chryseobacterium rhizosphaerae]|uniref:EmrB/QacA subfamily drug resistance transporter n=1 Tax=Chryseobacterium rhizosphaerae TaxID=395937 RepID=A0AAE4C4M2_9FLAO|nr:MULTISPECIES: MFS transporter [Chryseobacterium]MBL3547215.1 MFS transporter [Chryseobacterium sp. KMC2]MDR6528798.1 EmrB/QacA subfamily drug resistance transporter [Chryseobacterium rhizosphaerae]